MQGARKIDYAAFERALPLLAEAKGVPAADVRRRIVLSEGPCRNSSVTPDFVRLHDDKTTFTGEYSPGPPCCRSLPPVGDAVRQVPHKEVPRQVWSLCHGCSWTIPADFVRLHDDKTTFTGECYPGPLLLLLAPCQRCIETGP